MNAPPSVKVSYDENGLNSPKPSKKKAAKNAYRRSDSTASAGSRSRSATKELALPPDDSLMCPPSFITGLKPDLEIRDGSMMELKVQVKGDPDPQVTWTKDGKTLTSNDILEVKYKNGVSSVTINEIFPEDAGKYACKATNTKGSVETSSKVTVSAMAKGAKSLPGKSSTGGALNGSSALTTSAPRIYKHVNSSVVKDGDPVRLECTVAGGSEDARFDVVWLHNEKEIKPSKDFQYKKVGDNVHILEIQEIFPEDAGTYTCEAFNESGECFSSCTLMVDVPGEDLPKPSFRSFPSSLSVAKNKSASFLAELTGGSAKEVTWMKDGKVINEIEMKLRMTAKGSKLSLDVMECNSSDAGQYALIVTGEHGSESKAAFSLNVH